MRHLSLFVIASIGCAAADRSASTPDPSLAVRDASQPTSIDPEPNRFDDPQTIDGELEDFIRIRCSTDGEDVFIAWTGHAYAYLPGERPTRVFDLVGMNVASCRQGKQGWELSSRELMLYLDPETGERLERWDNPWTEKTVPVVHVANDPVQMKLGTRGFSYEVAGGVARFGLDVPLFYPNALADDPKLAAFSPQKNYQAGEFFVLMAPAEQVADSDRESVEWMSLSWHRISPWLPWMAMGERPGRLVFSADGAKLETFEDLPGALRREIETNSPSYAHAPSCWIDAPNETSWSYFERHLQDYLAGESFPRPRPDGPDRCTAGGPTSSP